MLEIGNQRAGMPDWKSHIFVILRRTV